MMTKEDYLNEYKTHKSMRDNVKRDNYRLQYHLMPPTGFLNDPNGLIQKEGVYHIYFQSTSSLNRRKRLQRGRGGRVM